MTSETLFHHAIEYCPRSDEALIHRDQVSWRAGKKVINSARALFFTKKSGHTTLLAVLIDQFDNLWTEGHARAVELLNFLIIGEIIFRGVQSPQHGQQPINVGCL